MKHLIAILFVLLLIAGVVIYLLIRERAIANKDRILEAREFRLKQKEGEAKIVRRDSAISSLLSDRREDSVRHEKEQTRFKRQANASRSRVTGPPVVQDTVIIYLDSLVADLEQQVDTVYKTDNRVLDSLFKSNYQLKQLFTIQVNENLRLEDENEDLKKKSKRRFSIGPHAGYGIRGADIGVSVQYSLLRF